MNTTIKLMAEQVQALLTAGAPQAKATTSENEIKMLITQVANAKLGAEYVSMVLNDGERIPDGSMKVTYEDVPVTHYKGKSRCILPAMPIQLPRNMGVWEIMNPEDLDCQFIPIPSGQRWMIQKEPILSNMVNAVLFEVNGLEVLFQEDLTVQTPPIEKVLIRLIVADINKLGDYDIMPLPAGMAADIVQSVYQILASKGNPDQQVDPAAQQTFKK